MHRNLGSAKQGTLGIATSLSHEPEELLGLFGRKHLFLEVLAGSRWNHAIRPDTSYA
jgi:hypothetical protein